MSPSSSRRSTQKDKPRPARAGGGVEPLTVGAARLWVGEETRGYGVQQDYAEAVRWYRKAAEQGLAAAQFMIRYNVSSRIEETLHLKKVDEDFFAD